MCDSKKTEDSVLYFGIKEVVDDVVSASLNHRAKYNDGQVNNASYQELTEKEIDEGVQKLMDYIKGNNSVEKQSN